MKYKLDTNENDPHLARAVAIVLMHSNLEISQFIYEGLPEEIKPLFKEEPHE